eukprot:gene19869-25420_t
MRTPIGAVLLEVRDVKRVYKRRDLPILARRAPIDRLITIEDVRELSLRNQPNHVRLFYSQGAQGQAIVTPGQLLAGAKRQRPDRIFLSELRTGDEVYDYLVSVNTGHPGSITSVHADSAQMAF